MTAVVPFPPRTARAPRDNGARAALLRAAVTASRELFDADEAALVLWDEGADAPRAPIVSGARRSAPRVVYCAPLAIAGESLGIIRVTNPSRGRPLRDSELLLLNQVAAELATALGSPPEGRMGTLPMLPHPNVFTREGDFWSVAHAGAFARVRDGKGMRQIALLLASPGREHHVLDLVGAGAHGVGGALATSEPLLDPESRRAYRARIASLRAEIEQARVSHDSARVERAQAELEFLVAELQRCLGLGGRARTAASPAERARQNVTRSIRAAIRHLATHQAALARHFERTIRTGLFCSYDPDPRAPIAWEL